VKLSAAMIVKNESRLLPQCLDSIKDYVDEIVVVDTGSTDNTMEIARSYGATIYEHPWQNDFSLHRNQSIGYATGDWFLIIDADEQFAPIQVSKEELKKRFEGLPENVYGLLVTLNSIDRNGHTTATSQSLRFFRNHIGVKYEGYIHNRVVLPEGGHGAPSDFVMYHYGYDLDEKTMEAKFERSSSLLYKRAKENPEDYTTYYFLCNLLASHEKWDEAIEYGARCIALLPPERYIDKKAPYVSLYHTVGMIYCARLNNAREALRWIANGLWLFPNNIDLNYDMLHIGVFLNKPGKRGNKELFKHMRQCGERYLKLYDLYTKQPHLAYCQAFLTMNAESKGRVEGWLKR